MMPLEEFRQLWVGRKFKCLSTGDILVIPDDVRETQFFTFGACYIDVGRLGYCRVSGDFIEITEQQGV